MDSRLDAKRMKVESDRLSSLPDDLIHNILSSISLKQAIETSSLSSRWRYIWTSIPYLDFSTQSFSKLKKFSKFVTNILSRRDNQVQLSSVKVCFRGKATQVFVKRILNYAFSHNIEQLTFESHNNITFPINLFSSQSLKHLTLTLSSWYDSCTVTSTWDLPALTTLCLTSIKLDDDLFSNFPNLKNLTLICCDPAIRLPEESGKFEESHLNICLSKLSNLTLKYLTWNVMSFLWRKIVKCLSSSAELISHQPSPFANLKSLKIYPALKTLHVKANVSTFVESYFLDSSPGVTLTMVLREDIRAHELMEEVQKLLNGWKANSDKNTAQVDLGEVENQTAQQETMIESQSGERLTQIKSYWSDLTKWSEEGEERKADTFMDNMMDRVRIHCDKKPRHSNIHCHELATPSQPFP
uniref:F-box domain-containing protein n=1 Tax=Tanacetum cinerariifolium TaxID=118510 RepID=A0A6L2MK88_TANCI|nr:hypothetical protein [Tanacetum cinerariifolium]